MKFTNKYKEQFDKYCYGAEKEFKQLSDDTKNLVFITDILSNSVKYDYHKENVSIFDCLNEDENYTYWVDDANRNDDEHNICFIFPFAENTVNPENINNKIQKFIDSYDRNIDSFSNILELYDADEKIEKIIKILILNTNYKKIDIKQLLNLKSSGFKIEIYDEQDFMNNIFNDSGVCIKSGEILIDKSNNFLEYEIEDNIINKSIICNISALSIKKLWEKYDKNLLGMNLRYFVKKKAVDEKIEKSIKEEPKYFWLKNNGLVIICSDYKIDNRKIILNNFSIINGGQTTYNISNSNNISENIYLVCKIISLKDMSNNPPKSVLELSKNISIATNQQKAISNADLISNNDNLNACRLKFQNLNPKFFIICKKGETKSQYKDKTSANYQIVGAEKILQLSKAFHDMVPGTCRAAKAKLYEKQSAIDEVFTSVKDEAKIHSELVILICCNDYFKTKKGQEELSKLGDDISSTLNFVKYCGFFFISMIKFVFVVINAYENSNKIVIDKISSIINTRTNKEPKQYESELKDYINEQFAKLKIKSLFREDIGIGNEKTMKELYKSVVSSTIFKSTILNSIEKWRNDNHENDAISNFGKTNKDFFYCFIPALNDQIEKTSFIQAIKTIFKV